MHTDPETHRDWVQVSFVAASPDQIRRAVDSRPVAGDLSWSNASVPGCVEAAPASLAGLGGTVCRLERLLELMALSVVRLKGEAWVHGEEAACCTEPVRRFLVNLATAKGDLAPGGVQWEHSWVILVAGLLGIACGAGAAARRALGGGGKRGGAEHVELVDRA